MSLTNEVPSIRLTDFHPGYQFLQYQLLEQIGYGGQGFVWSALDQPRNRITAIKFNEVGDPEQKPESETQFKRQASQLIRLNHPNILPLYDFGSLFPIRYLVSPYVAGGSLQDRLIAGDLSIDDILRYSRRIASALDYLHGQGIIHRDLKPSNILLDFGNRLYVADFGLARVIADTTQALHTGHGTPPYAPPEQHTMRELTYKSDIFGFGVMLYQMFTRQLPWDGEKSLGLQQLYSKEEIPDPREINPDLPPKILDVLRAMTAANPDARVKSATESVRLIYAVFGKPMPSHQTSDLASMDTEVDVGAMLKQSMRGWDPDGGTVRLSLSKFAVLDLEQKQTGQDSAAGTDVPVFMLQNALTYGYNDDFWWSKVENPKERLLISNQLLSKENPVISERIVKHLVEDDQIRSLKAKLPEKMTMSFLDAARRTEDQVFKSTVFETLRDLTPPAKQWRETALGQAADMTLATLALDPPPSGGKAASLIGYLRSQKAVEAIARYARGERRSTALLRVRQSAGSLPATLPRQVHLEITAEWIARRLIDQPVVLLTVFAWIILGVGLSTGLFAFITYRLPQFWDSLRILNSLEHGFIMGVLFGFGILITRILVERFPESNAFLRVALAIVLGTLMLNIAVFTYDVLMNDFVPQGYLIGMGSLIIATGFALSGLVRLRIVRILITAVAVMAALAGTWWGHILLMRADITMTPLYFFEYVWTPTRVLLIMAIIALPMSVFGNLGNLSPQHE